MCLSHYSNLWKLAVSSWHQNIGPPVREFGVCGGPKLEVLKTLPSPAPTEQWAAIFPASFSIPLHLVSQLQSFRLVPSPPMSSLVSQGCVLLDDGVLHQVLQ